MRTGDIMNRKPPLVTVGLAVYNGALYLKSALDSLLAQSFTNFELVISDNASTDDTPLICREYVSRDSRVRYVCNATNLGAAQNFNRVFALARGEYFMWAAHDDAYHSEYLTSCLAILENFPEVVLCFTQEVGIDEQGKSLGMRPYRLDTTLRYAEDRFIALLRLDRGSPPIFGLIRTDVLRKTSLIGSYDGSDQVLLAELALQGAFHQIPQDLLLHREHGERSVYQHRDRHSATIWFDTAKERKIIFPQWRWFYGYCRAIGRAPLTMQQKGTCALHMLRWMRMRRNGRKMIDDVKVAFWVISGRVLGMNKRVKNVA